MSKLASDQPIEVADCIVYLVKTDAGYYSESQPHYTWSYTQDVNLAKRYKTYKKAKDRGEDGINLVSNPIQSYEIETYVLKIRLEKVIAHA